jgi:glycerate kinase
MLGLFNATMRPGIELVLDLLHAREACAWADVVITGEGSIDGQTPYGKVPSGIARLAKSQGKPVIAIGGKVTRDSNVTAALNEAGIVATFGIAPGPAALPELLADTERNVEATCAAIAGLLSVARECSSRPHQ